MRPRISNWQRGFTLMETMAVLALTSIVVLGVAALMLESSKNSFSNQTQASLLEAVTALRQALTTKRSALAAAPPACTSVFGYDTGLSTSFNTTGKTYVQAAVEGNILKRGANLGKHEQKIADFYLSDPITLGVPAGGKSNYLTNLYMQAQTTSLLKYPRKVATMAVEIDATGQLTKCNVSFTVVEPQEACEDTFGMRWNPLASECQEALADDSTTTNFACPPGFQGTPPSCKPIPSSCASGQIATGYALGQVRGCTAPPASAPVLVPRAPEPFVAEGAPAPAPPPDPVQPVFAPPATVQTTSSSAGPAPSPTCVDGTNVSSLSIDACGAQSYPGVWYEGNSCQWTAPPPVSSSCEVRPSVPYQTPDLSLPAKQPDPPAPPDLSCQCNSRRIPDGEYCMYCIRDVDLGYGYADYTYGVMQCTGGNLIDVPVSPSMVTPAVTCTNNYGRARRLSPAWKFQQYNEL